MATYMEMLKLGADVSSQVYNQVATQLDRTLEVHRQVANQEIDLSLKGLQFGEEIRKNDMATEEAQFQNFLRSEEHGMKKKEFGIRMSMIPLEREAANLRLENERFRLSKTKELEADKLFNETTSIFDQGMNMFLVESESVEAAKEYISYKAKWKTKVANGEPFDGDKYDKGLKEIIQHYSDPMTFAPSRLESWTPEKQYLFSSISKELGDVMERKNPINLKNSNALAGSFLGMPQTQVGQFMGQYGNFWDNEYLGALGAAREKYQSNQNRMIGLLKQHDDLSSRLERARAAPDGIIDVAKLKEAADKTIEDYKKLHDENDKLMSDSLSGRLLETEVPITGSAIADQMSEDTRRVADTFDSGIAEEKKSSLGASPSTQQDEKRVYQRLKDLENVFEGTEGINPLDGITTFNFKHYQDNVTKRVDFKNLTNIRTKVEANLRAMANHRGLDEALNEETMEKVFKMIKREQIIPISEELGNLLHGKKDVPTFANDKSSKSAGLIIGKGGRASNLLDFFTANPIRVTSVDSVNNLLDYLKINNKGQREEVKIEIYAALWAAALKEAVESDRK